MNTEHARQAAQELKAATRDPQVTAGERIFANVCARSLARALDACADDAERLEVLAGAIVTVARSASRAALNAVGLDVLAGGFDPAPAPAPEPEPPAEDDPSTHTEPRPGVWYRVLPGSEQGALVALFPFESLLGKRLEYRHPNGDTGVIESYDYDLPEPCEFRVALRAVD